MYERLSTECLRLLTKMGGAFKDIIPIPSGYPGHAAHLYDNTSTEAHYKVAFLYNATHQIVNLFENNTANIPGSWDQTSLDNLLNVLHRQEKDLQTCACQNHTGILKLRETQREKAEKLQRHFHKVHLFLQEKNYSLESWEVVRKEVERHLKRMLFLAMSMQ
ncbi:interferon a3-like [Engraulis encrasicolus]|uniref:interferon a3-like n=1 Tax=Engraulis encrasicolus TaxID=184585 RepID=UPI002FCED768